ncbi:MAG: SpoVG family protein [Candidatus Omnitrophica bacterium]|nr:SpoVG family protein [Candidatus Omnitrophota bacterium]
MNSQDIQVKRLHKLDKAEGKLKGFVDIAVQGALLIKGLRIMDGRNGLFVGMPCEQGKNGQWYPTVLPLNKEVKQQINELILQAYEEQV